MTSKMEILIDHPAVSINVTDLVLEILYSLQEQNLDFGFELENLLEDPELAKLWAEHPAVRKLLRESRPKPSLAKAVARSELALATEQASGLPTDFNGKPVKLLPDEPVIDRRSRAELEDEDEFLSSF